MNGLYIHIPFCKSKCRYCDFASYDGKLSTASTYVDAVCAEMELYKGESFDTVYFGGGTPTLLSEELFEKLFWTISRNFTLSSDCEITVEANPATLDADKAESLVRLGVNRISLGAQSMIDSELMMLGRIHSSEDTVNTYNIVRSVGISNVSLDLMYALPGQNMDGLSKSVDGVLNLQPEHISCYGLKIEDGTPFALMADRGEIQQPDDDISADMYDYIVSALEDNGYERYEISNFAKPGYRSRHNCKYWTCTDYIGIGLGASSCYKGERYTNCPDFGSYFDGYKKAEHIVLDNDDKTSEFIILGLRLINDGVSKEQFYNRFGCDIYSVFGKYINKHISDGLLVDDGSNIHLTRKGCYVSNYVMSDFLL